MPSVHPSPTPKPPPPSRGERGARTWSLLLSGLALLLAFWPWWTAPGEVPFSRSGDLLRHYLPFKQSLHRLFEVKRLAGDLGLPGWNPHTLGGHPMVADPGYGAFYPPGWLFLILPPEHTFILFFGLHILLGFGLTVAVGRRLRLGWSASCLAGLAFSLNLKLIGTLYAGFATMIPAQSWLPGAFLGLLLWLQARSLAQRLLGLTCMGLSLACQVLAGDAQLMLYTGLGLGMGAVLMGPMLQTPGLQTSGLQGQELNAATATEPTSQLTNHPRRMGLVGILLAGGLATLLAWPLLHAASMLTRASVRAGGIAFPVAMQLANHPSHLPGMILPALSGADIDLTWRGPDSFWETSFGPGLLVWTFALLALLRFPSDRRILPLWGSAWLTLVLSYGASGPFYPLLFFLMPGVDHFRGPARILPLLALWLGLLAGLELDARTRAPAGSASHRVVRGVALGGLVSSGLGLLWLLGDSTTIQASIEAHARALVSVAGAGARGEQALRMALVEAVGLFVLLRWAFGSPFWTREHGWRLRRLCLGLVGLSLGWQAQAQLQTVPLSEVLPTHPLAERLAQLGSSPSRGSLPPPRILDLTGALTDLVAVDYELPIVNGMNPLVSARAYTFWRFVQGETPEVPANQPIYGLLIDRVVHPELLELLRIQTVVREVPEALPGFVLGENFTNVQVFHQFLGISTYASLHTLQREHELPPVWQVTHAALAPEDPAARLALLTHIDPYQGVLLETVPASEGGSMEPMASASPDQRLRPEVLTGIEGLPLRTDSAPGTTGVTIETWEADRIFVRVEAPASGGVLIFSELWAPGWHAAREAVEGPETAAEPLPLWRADHLLRAVPLEPGPQRIVLWYAPY